MNPRSVDVARSANLIIRRLLAVQPGEQVAIVCDPHSEMSMAYALAGVVESVGAEYTILTMPTRTTERKNELTPPIERALEAADCLLGLTGSCGAPTYSKAVKRLFEAKQLRALSMVMRSLDNFTEGGARADYDALYSDGEALAEMARVVRPGGVVVVVDFLDHEHEWMRQELGVHWLGFEPESVAGWFREAGLVEFRLDSPTRADAARDLPATFIASGQRPA